jgi:hypothetical protein
MNVRMRLLFGREEKISDPNIFIRKSTEKETPHNEAGLISCDRITSEDK